jgi:hypothetical protein
LFDPADGNPRSFNWGAGVLEACARFRQGDVVRDVSIAFAFYDAAPVTALAKRSSRGTNTFAGVRADLQYGMITSQTCDLAGKRGKKYPLITVAPVYDIIPHVESGHLGNIRANLVGEMIPLDGPEFARDGELWVADLRLETAVEKGVLSHRSPMKAFSGEEGYLLCSRKIARVRLRVAIDDDVDEKIIRPFRGLLESGAISHSGIIDVLIQASPELVRANAVRLYAVVDATVDARDLQKRFDDWQATVVPKLPPHLTFLGIQVRREAGFNYAEARLAEPLDLDYLSDDG